MRFKKVRDEDVVARLKKICGYENIIPISSGWQLDGLEALAFVANGDMRVAINGLQSSIAGFGRCTKETVYKVCDAPNPVVVNRALKCVLQKQANHAFEELKSLVDKGYAPTHVLQTVAKCVRTLECTEFQRMEYLRLVAEAHVKATQGCSSLIQLDLMMTSMTAVKDPALAGA